MDDSSQKNHRNGAKHSGSKVGGYMGALFHLFEWNSRSIPSKHLNKMHVPAAPIQPEFSSPSRKEYRDERLPSRRKLFAASDEKQDGIAIASPRSSFSGNPDQGFLQKNGSQKRAPLMARLMGLEDMPKDPSDQSDEQKKPTSAPRPLHELLLIKQEPYFLQELLQETSSEDIRRRSLRQKLASLVKKPLELKAIPSLDSFRKPFFKDSSQDASKSRPNQQLQKIPVDDPKPGLLNKLQISPCRIEALLSPNGKLSSSPVKSPSKCKRSLLLEAAVKILEPGLQNSRCRVCPGPQLIAFKKAEYEGNSCEDQSLALPKNDEAVEHELQSPCPQDTQQDRANKKAPGSKPASSRRVLPHSSHSRKGPQVNVSELIKQPKKALGPKTRSHANSLVGDVSSDASMRLSSSKDSTSSNSEHSIGKGVQSRSSKRSAGSKMPLVQADSAKHCKNENEVGPRERKRGDKDKGLQGNKIFPADGNTTSRIKQSAPASTKIGGAQVYNRLFGNRNDGKSIGKENKPDHSKQGETSVVKSFLKRKRGALDLSSKGSMVQKDQVSLKKPLEQKRELGKEKVDVEQANVCCKLRKGELDPFDGLAIEFFSEKHGETIKLRDLSKLQIAILDTPNNLDNCAARQNFVNDNIGEKAKDSYLYKDTSFCDEDLQEKFISFICRGSDIEDPENQPSTDDISLSSDQPQPFDTWDYEEIKFSKTDTDLRLSFHRKEEGQPSPVSVLEPPFEDDSNESLEIMDDQDDFPSTRLQDILSMQMEDIPTTATPSGSIQTEQIMDVIIDITRMRHLDPVSVGIDEKFSEWSRDEDESFIEEIFSRACSFGGNVEWYSEDLPIDPLILERTNICKESNSWLLSRKSQRVAKQNSKLLFDCVNEILNEKPWCCNKVVSLVGHSQLLWLPSRKQMMEEVLKHLSDWKSSSALSIEDHVDQGMTTWMDFRQEVVELGLDIECTIFKVMVQELVQDLIKI